MRRASVAAYNVLRTALPILLKRGYEIRIFIVWPPDLPVAEQLANAIGLNCSAVYRLDSVGNALSFFETQDVIISFKLHAAVLAFARNVPVVMLDYTSKCRDFADSILWTEYIERCEMIQADQLVEMVDRALDSRSALANRISLSLDGLRRTFEEYCDFLGHEALP
jgi:polysaccharide pyruvyl transferase WcaK-like protein